MASKNPPVSKQAKQLLIDEMERQGVSKTDLARLLKARPQEITRLTDLNWTTKIDAIADALKKLGRSLNLRVVPIAKPAAK